MFNQLTASSGRRKQKKNIYQQFLKRTHESEPIQRRESSRNGSTLKQRQQKLLNRLIDSSTKELDNHNISQSIKARLKSTRVQLPPDVYSFRHEPLLRIDPEDIRLSSKNGYLTLSNHEENENRYRKKRFKTQMKDLIQESQTQSIHPYEQTMIQIDDLNRLFTRNNNRKMVKYNLLQIKQGFSTPHRLSRLNRKNDLQRYINHLERMHYHKSQLRNHRKVQTPINYLESPPRKKLPDISPKIIKQETPAKNEIPILKSDKNDSFIKILRKVKARGQSLLVKLNKFPSNSKLIQ